jgi:hypothetical protein
VRYSAGGAEGVPAGARPTALSSRPGRFHQKRHFFNIIEIITNKYIYFSKIYLICSSNIAVSTGLQGRRGSACTANMGGGGAQIWHAAGNPACRIFKKYKLN